MAEFTDLPHGNRSEETKQESELNRQRRIAGRCRQLSADIRRIKINISDIHSRRAIAVRALKQRYADLGRLTRQVRRAHALDIALNALGAAISGGQLWQFGAQ